MSARALDDPVQFAALIAPVLDRVVISVHLAAHVRDRHRIEGPIGSLVELRLPLLAAQPVAHVGFNAVARYVPDRELEVEAQVAYGRLAVGSDRELLATASGRALVADLVATFDEVIAERWSHRAASVPDLDALAARAVEAGRASGGDAFAVIAGAPLPKGIAVGFELWSRAAMLRYHRADAHAAAWAAHGFTAEQIVAMAPGAERNEIEVETNRRAAGPWVALSPSERLELLAGLGAL